ncbi:Eukaryotic peptide chain release factor GTP-binding subunit [Frankliniella fusca]|uniref:Eukaryotic peptide chain release factor GTP-binding subunit n=1 Tax=Frankliniella fusca TaxID=407009 RepID=A0AAE1HTP7_9NEOP|nr:Eukaryotic peptide chain release factor GTP-binding subunit [Frankliniella fusca]
MYVMVALDFVPEQESNARDTTFSLGEVAKKRLLNASTSSLRNTFYLTSKNTIVKTMKEAQYCIMETIIKNILGLPHSLEMTLLNTIHQVVNISE